MGSTLDCFATGANMCIYFLLHPTRELGMGGEIPVVKHACSTAVGRQMKIMALD